MRDYLEARVDARPPVEVLLSPSDGLMRDLPATIPGAPNYDPRNVAWSLVAESPASPVVVPGERIRLRAMCRNTTARPQQVALDLAWEGALESEPVALAQAAVHLGALRTAHRVGAVRIPGGRHALHGAGGQRCRAASRLPAGRQPVGDLATGRVLARAGEAVVGELPLIAVRPWKQFAPYPEHLRAEQGAPAGFGIEPVRADPVVGIAGRPAGHLLGQ